ncbi:MAG: hypothetical protein E7141_03780 [Rikenellaceae bacterium]|nr:hypothetical protein [Rikenellaceae bacterium]
MKNFTKLLMAVVLLASYSCVQDTTEDLAPTISGPTSGSGELKTLQVSLPVSSRTELGEKVDGKYPVAWCEDDVLAVNGKPTTGIRISEEAANVAVFELPLGITIPYNIVYPYPGEDVVAGSEGAVCPVVFASEQKHTEGTFAPNSAPMYAWSNGFDDVHMEHLATALRFSIKAKAGETVDLKYISVATVGAEPISGVFDVYCTDVDGVAAGTLKARESAVSTVFYTFEGDSYIVTDSKEEVFYIAVPKGEYSRFEVNFVEQNGFVYSETFDASGDKQLLGGKVREFPTVEFESNSKMLLIGTDVDMETFANEVKAGTFNEKYDGALLVSDIDMTGKEWTPVEGFTSLFEGRNYTIKGMTAPLFGENVVATISNVGVEGTLVEAACGKVGLIARSLSVDGDKVGTIFNCSAKGSIEYKNEQISVNENYDLINVGGVVGGVYGGSVSLSESDVDVTILTAAGADGADKIYTPCIGGVVGYACAVGEKLPVVVENTSNGVVVWDDNSASSKVTPFIGGVAGYVTAGTFTDNVNAGELYINEAMYDLDWGGVIGASAVSVVRCENKGSLTINETVARANIGGVVGQLTAESIVDCENSGKLLLDEAFHINETCNIGGVVAYVDKGTKDVESCLNSGSITYLGSCQYESRTTIIGNANIILGGVIGFCWAESVKNCRNLESAVINVAGKVSGNGDIKRNIASVDKMTAIAGVIGTRAGKQSVLGSQSAVTTENCSNFGNVSFTWQYCGASYIFNSACIGVFDSDRAVACKNEGSVLVQANVSTDTVTHDTTSTLVVFISGMFGCISSTCDQILDCENAGSVTVDNSSSRMMWVSGLLGTAMDGVNIKFTRCANTGNIVVGENVHIRNVYVGGILANTLDIKLQYPNCYNSGQVESKATATAETYLGSIFGLSTGSDTGAGTEGIQNTGRVIYSGKSALAYVGGYCGRYEEKKHTVQFANAATGVVECNGTASFIAFVGGVAGLGGSVTTNSLSADAGVVKEIRNINGITGGVFEKGMVNNGNVTINGYAPTVYISGGFGYINSTSNGVGGITNNGVVNVPDNSTATEYPRSIYMGGVFGYAKMNAGYPTTAGANTKYAINNCHNYGNILYNGIARDGAYVGGLVGAASKAPIISCSNNGDVVSTGHAGEASPKLTQTDDKKQHDSSRPNDYIGWAFNYKNHDLAVGGLVGETDLDIVDSENTGAVTHTCSLSPIKIDHNGDKSTSRFDVGGIAGRTFVPHSVHGNNYSILLAGLNNSGAVTIYGAPSATNNTPSIDLGDGGVWQWSDIDDADRTNLRLFYRVNSGGLFGRLMDNSSAHVKHYLNNCTNSAPVSTPEAAGAKCYSTAGVVGELLVSHAEFNGVKNTGKVSIEKAGVGTVIDGSKYIDAYFINMGGLVGTFFDSRIFELSGNYIGSVTFNDCQNDGDIHYGEVAASIYQCAGGILGQTLYFIRDACLGSPCAPEGETYTGSGTKYGCADVKFYRCKNNGNINYLSTAMNLSQGYNYNYAGGILGSGSIGHNSVKGTFSSVDLLFDHCENTGEVQFDRNNSVMSTNASPAYTVVGGIIGHYCGGVGHATSATSHSYSGKGTITTSNCYNAQIISCKNSGRIWGYSGYIGGIAGTCNWFVKITGTEDDPTINTGDIVVIRENGKVVTKNRYGSKYIYAGGIAGGMMEYTNAIYAVGNASGNPAYPAYKPEDQYVRIEYAVNEGAVGSTGYAGGIAGYYYSAVQASKQINKATSRGGLEFCRNTGDIYALEGATTNIGSIVGMPRIANDADIYTLNTDNATAKALSEGTWQIGVQNCYVGGSVLRGAVGEIKINETNYMQAIYGVSWDDTYESVVEGKSFDGCTFYVPAKEETPGEENGGENNE